MKNQAKNQKATAAKPKVGKVSSALTGPGLLTPGELGEVSGGGAAGTTRLCIGPGTVNGTR